jgi:hypothetical protein
MPDYTKKVSPSQAVDIHKRAVAGESPRELAREFGVSERTIGRYKEKSLDDLIRSFEESLRALPKRPKGKSYSAPFTRPVEPIALSSAKGVLRRGSITITPEGSQMQVDADGRIRKVLRCPIYSGPWHCVRVADVDVLSYDGGRGRGRVTSLSGNAYEGDLIFETKTIKHMDFARMVVRIEFHPDES